MKINKIVLYNVGSYEGLNVFDASNSDENKTIVLIGGKNGTGKTTLFTGMRLCLYGFFSLGYTSPNSLYKKSVTKLINNNAKLSSPIQAYVEMEIVLSNGRGLDTYLLRREWDITGDFVETFSVACNAAPMANEDIADFEKYLLSIIPPELFNMYFFDGERIADFFLEDGGSTRFKDAFLTLCGYDTFEIMRKNFKRIGGTKKKATSPALGEYLSTKEAYEDKLLAKKRLVEEAKICSDDIEDCESRLAILEKGYREKGGITQEQWDEKVYAMREEERKREQYNTLLKKWANEIVPFVMLRRQLQLLQDQIVGETEQLKKRHFFEVLECDNVKALLGEYHAPVKDLLQSFNDRDSKTILDLSYESSALLTAKVHTLLAFDVERISKCKKAIKQSIALSAKLRKELESSNVSRIQEYLKARAELFEKKSVLLVKKGEIEQRISVLELELATALQDFERAQSKLEEQLKQESITDLSTRAIVMLDKLRSILYTKQLAKLEEHFRQEVKCLMRKSSFIDDIWIDEDFSIHIIRYENFERAKLLEMLGASSEAKLQATLGVGAWKELQKITESQSIDQMLLALIRDDKGEYKLPVEIDKGSLSNGEKQIFIMSLYYALVQLCPFEVPFVIDTPFARIDSEHRQNISEFFFSKLRGQVFILSTNEEINATHLQIIKPKVAAQYLLENVDNKRTYVVKDSYFEE